MLYDEKDRVLMLHPAREGKNDAMVAAGFAFRSATDEPVVFITGNNFVPALRAFGIAEIFWQAAEISPDSWAISAYEWYAEAFEAEMDRLNVYLGFPEHDNALYVVDLNRFEHVDEPTGDSLNDEWRSVPRKCPGHGDDVSCEDDPQRPCLACWNKKSGTPSYEVDWSRQDPEEPNVHVTRDPGSAWYGDHLA